VQCATYSEVTLHQHTSEDFCFGAKIIP